MFLYVYDYSYWKMNNLIGIQTYMTLFLRQSLQKEDKHPFATTTLECLLSRLHFCFQGPYI